MGRIPRGTPASDTLSSPPVVVTLKTYAAPKAEIPIRAGEVCGLLKEGTKGWILLQLKSGAKSWYPSSYAEVFPAFSYSLQDIVGQREVMGAASGTSTPMQPTSGASSPVGRGRAASPAPVSAQRSMYDVRIPEEQAGLVRAALSRVKE